MATSHLPSALRVECKFTTSHTINLSRRELEALYIQRGNEAGIVAVLFWHGTTDPNGRWLLVDAKESVRLGSGSAVSLSSRDLERLDRTQKWLYGIREYVAEYWRPFLAAFWKLSLEGHSRLCTELSTLHADGKLRDQVEDYCGSVIDIDHRNAIDVIVRQLGESGAGRVFQDLFAYLLGMAGYRIVNINPTGVPDIDLMGLEHNASANGDFIISLSRDQLTRMIDLAQAAGEKLLVNILRESLRQYSPRE